MIMLALLGMHPLAAFPIMMSAGALQQLVWEFATLEIRSLRIRNGRRSGLRRLFRCVSCRDIGEILPVIVLRWLVAAVALDVAVGLSMAELGSLRDRRLTA
jgi:hypothetical protein